jgi:hypothetical protein
VGRCDRERGTTNVASSARVGARQRGTDGLRPSARIGVDVTALFVLLGAEGAFLVWACRHVGVQAREWEDVAEADWPLTLKDGWVA